jgi:hypothetical protein
MREQNERTLARKLDEPAFSVRERQLHGIFAKRAAADEKRRTRLGGESKEATTRESGAGLH